MKHENVIPLFGIAEVPTIKGMCMIAPYMEATHARKNCRRLDVRVLVR